MAEKVWACCRGLGLRGYKKVEECSVLKRSYEFSPNLSGGGHDKELLGYVLDRVQKPENCVWIPDLDKLFEEIPKVQKRYADEWDKLFDENKNIDPKLKAKQMYVLRAPLFWGLDETDWSSRLYSANLKDIPGGVNVGGILRENKKGRLWARRIGVGGVAPDEENPLGAKYVLKAGEEVGLESSERLVAGEFVFVLCAGWKNLLKKDKVKALEFMCGWGDKGTSRYLAATEGYELEKRGEELKDFVENYGGLRLNLEKFSVDVASPRLGVVSVSFPHMKSYKAIYS